MRRLSVDMYIVACQVRVVARLALDLALPMNKGLMPGSGQQNAKNCAGGVRKRGEQYMLRSARLQSLTEWPFRQRCSLFFRIHEYPPRAKRK